LNSNVVFPNFSESEFQELKNKLKERFRLTNKPVRPGTKEALEVETPEGKINFIYYKKGKLMIQSSPSNSEYVSIVNEISKSSSSLVDRKIEVISKEESELTSDFYIGCDEAGAGETFGSMFLGCAMISHDNLNTISEIIRGRNIRELTSDEISKFHNAISNLFKSEIKSYSASEIDAGSKNQLLDKGYIELLQRFLPGISNASIVIDDYGIKEELKKFLNSLKSRGNEIITINKADEKYTACKIASLIARKARMEEIESINKTSFLNSQISNRIILPGSGAASNPGTAQYLIEYRKKFPTSDFPPFVRKKWKNVVEIDTKFPRQEEN